MNKDKPLVLGRLTTIIGEAGVNIANLVLGRDKPGGNASTILNLDDPIDQEALDRIRGLQHIKQARQLYL
jgi:D-3-phosphoglycerate dehydrogenase